MFKLKFIKIIILSFLTAIFVIIVNINTVSINAQSSNNLIELQSELDILSQQYEQFTENLIPFQEILKDELIKNEKNKSDWINPVKAGIESETENESFINLYKSWQNLKQKRDEFTKKQGINQDFSSIDELAIIINPLQDGKVSPQEICNIQKKLGIVDTFNFTQTFDAQKPNSCGYFLAVTHGEMERKLNQETEKLEQDIDNIQTILNSNSTNSLDNNVSKADEKDSNMLILFLTLFSISALILIVILWQMIKSRSSQPIITNQKLLNNSNLPINPNSDNNISTEKKQKTTQKPIKKIKQNLEANIEKNNSITKELETNINSKSSKIVDFPNFNNTIPNPLESPQIKPQSLSEDSEETELILTITEETIDQVWKENKDKIEFEHNLDGEYLAIKTNEQEYDLYFNQEKKIKPAVFITCKKAGIFKIKGNVEYVNIEYIKPAQILQNKSEGWRLIQSGEIVLK